MSLSVKQNGLNLYSLMPFSPTVWQSPFLILVFTFVPLAKPLSLRVKVATRDAFQKAGYFLSQIKLDKDLRLTYIISWGPGSCIRGSSKKLCNFFWGVECAWNLAHHLPSLWIVSPSPTQHCLHWYRGRDFVLFCFHTKAPLLTKPNA